MTEPVDLPPAPPGPFVAPTAGAPAPAVEPWQHRLEVLAVILVLSVVAVLISAFVAAHAQLSVNFSEFGGEAPKTDFTEVVRLAGTSANLMAAGALLVALLLVTLGPGDRIGRTGTLVLRGIVGIGLITAGLGAISAVLTVTLDEGPLTAAALQAGVYGDGLIGKISGVAPLLVAAVISAYVAWCAFTTLGDVPPEPVFPEDDPGPNPAASF